MSTDYNRRAACAEGKDMTGKTAFAEVTEWYNGEGYDITINERPIISMTMEEWDLMHKAYYTLRAPA